MPDNFYRASIVLPSLRERERGKFSNRDTTRECAQLTRSIARNTMAFRPDVVKQRRSHFRAGVAQW